MYLVVGDAMLVVEVRRPPGDVFLQRAVVHADDLRAESGGNVSRYISSWYIEKDTCCL